MFCFQFILLFPSLFTHRWPPSRRPRLGRRLNGWLSQTTPKDFKPRGYGSKRTPLQTRSFGSFFPLPVGFLGVPSIFDPKPTRSSIANPNRQARNLAASWASGVTCGCAPGSSAGCGDCGGFGRWGLESVWYMAILCWNAIKWCTEKRKVLGLTKRVKLWKETRIFLKTMIKDKYHSAVNMLINLWFMWQNHS